MTPKPNKVSKQAIEQPSTNRENSTTEKERDSVIPTKDKSPDDLEILD